ncbi:protease modulator HflC [Bremerella sp. P1]|uniref:protease modulator HflC n=1 Tax=Bremerella sp. P1 TaxID=3026424 RepID=UPI002368DC8B|nr:protease modulator HflC [Bremerella sp. P1]WDI42495.1 protease modulator HflC [Bremerella sp. P1]
MENAIEHQSNQTAPLWTKFVRIGLGISIFILLVAYPCYVQVSEGTSVVVTRFGKPTRQLMEPGAYFKLPWPVEDARVVDLRQHVFNTPYTATLTHDRRNVVLSTFVVWNVADPLLFLQSSGSVEAVSAKIDGMVTAAKNTRMGGYDLSALVSTDSAQLQTQRIEQQLLQDVQQDALEKFGIQILQIGINRIAYESSNVSAVLAQMKAEREAAAKQLRALGEKDANAIRDDAVVRSEEILRDGRLEAGRIRADAEQKVSEIYAQAHLRDPEFYRYWRSLEALKRSLGSDSTIILRTNEGFMDLLTDPPQVPQTGSPSSLPTTSEDRTAKFPSGNTQATAERQP